MTVIAALQRWSKWEWDSSQQMWYASRLKPDGTYEYDYRSKDGAGDESQTPRTTNADIYAGTQNTQGSSTGPYQNSGTGYPDYPYNARDASPRSSFSSIASLTNAYYDSTVASSVGSTEHIFGKISLGPPPAQPIQAQQQVLEYPVQKHIYRAPYPGDSEYLDPRYKTVPEKDQDEFFKVGRVFMILWTEPKRLPPATMVPARGGSRNGSHFSTTWLNGTAYTEIRRFVIVLKQHGNSICWYGFLSFNIPYANPIHTYSNQATLKPNLPDVQQHTMIHTSKDPPELYSYIARDGSVVREQLLKVPIRVVSEQSSPDGQLDPRSRLNYSKIYIVEHDVPVLKIGMVHENSMASLMYNSPVKPSEPSQRSNANTQRASHKKHRKDRMHSDDPRWNISNRIGDNQHPQNTLTNSEIPASVIDNRGDIIESLVELLSSNGNVQIHYIEALKVSSHDEIEKILQRCLFRFSEDLQAEDSTAKLTSAALKIRENSGKLASRIRNMVQNRLLESVANKSKSRARSTQIDDSTQKLEIKGSRDPFHDTSEFSGLEFMQESKSWALFQENLQLELSFDQLRIAICNVWPVKVSRDSLYQIKYSIDWEIPSFKKQYFPDLQSIADILTLTENAGNTVAQTCEDYLTETWPEVSISVLKAVDEFLQTNTDTVIYGEHWSMTLHPQFGQSSSVVIIAITSSHRIHELVSAAMCWLISVLRPSSKEVVQQSSNLVKNCLSLTRLEMWQMKNDSEKDDSPRIAITLNQLQDIPRTPESDCWRHLFPKTVVAHGFPVKPRIQGRGLEISFPNMIAVTCSLSLVEVEDGLIADGLNSVLVPITQLVEDDAIQWHFRPKKAKGARKRLLYSEVLRDIGSWYKVSDVSRLIESRCFLGWVRQASILLGTAKFSGAKITWSDTKDCPTVRKNISYAFNFGTGGMGIVTATGAVTWTRVAMISSVVNPVDKIINDKIEDSRNKSILLYDAGSKISYYLPQTSFVLFMAQSISINRGYEITDGDKPTEFTMAKLGPDGGAHAYDAIKANLARKIKYRHSRIPGDQHCISKLFTDIWHSLEKVENELKNATDAFRGCKKAEPKYIFGVEYMELLTMESSMQIKQAMVDQPWAFLTKYHPIAIFCEGLPAPIAPFPLDQICSSYREIPLNRNVLVATARTVAEFLKRCKKGLCPNVAWHNKEILIQVHEFNRKTAINHVQYLKHDPSPKSNENLRKQVDEHLGGSFIFDGGPPRPCNCYAESSKSSLTNGPEQQKPQVSGISLLGTITDIAAERSYNYTNNTTNQTYTVASISDKHASHSTSQDMVTSNHINGSMNEARIEVDRSRTFGDHEMGDSQECQTAGQRLSSNSNHNGQPLNEQPENSQPPADEEHEESHEYQVSLAHKSFVPSTESPRSLKKKDNSSKLHSRFQEQAAIQ